MSREDYALLLKTGSSRQVRLALFAEEQAALLYSASEFAVLEGDAVGCHPYIARLGLDLIDPAIDASAVHTHLNAPRFAGKNIAALLLDQRFFAGVGNYLRSEILFGAKIPPHLVLGALNDHQRRALAKAAMDMVRQSYHTGALRSTRNWHLHCRHADGRILACGAGCLAAKGRIATLAVNQLRGLFGLAVQCFYVPLSRIVIGEPEKPD